MIVGKLSLFQITFLFIQKVVHCKTSIYEVYDSNNDWYRCEIPELSIKAANSTRRFETWPPEAASQNCSWRWCTQRAFVFDLSIDVHLTKAGSKTINFWSRKRTWKLKHGLIKENKIRLHVGDWFVIKYRVPTSMNLWQSRTDELRVICLNSSAISPKSEQRNNSVSFILINVSATRKIIFDPSLNIQSHTLSTVYNYIWSSFH